MLDDTALSIDTRFVESVPSNPDLGSLYKDKLEAITRRVAEIRLEGLGISMSQETFDMLTDVVVKLNMMHVKGDEKPELEMKKTILAFADLMESEVDPDSFVFDFPPEDNRVVIPLR
ncbi:hypothetical protein SDC9_146059 [bioreactor metagenome]|uniref:Uncharacterized protein n=2 Tax=root TaxID=1 RepID=A0A645EC19_9ZZZZ